VRLAVKKGHRSANERARESSCKKPHGRGKMKIFESLAEPSRIGALSLLTSKKKAKGERGPLTVVKSLCWLSSRGLMGGKG